MKKIKILLLMLVVCIFGLFGFNPSVNAADEFETKLIITEENPVIQVFYNGDSTGLDLEYTMTFEIESGRNGDLYFIINDFEISKNVYEELNMYYPGIGEIFDRIIPFRLESTLHNYVIDCTLLLNFIKENYQITEFSIFLISNNELIDMVYHEYNEEYYFVNYYFEKADGSILFYDRKLFSTKGTHYFLESELPLVDYAIESYNLMSDGTGLEFVPNQSEIEGNFAVYAIASWKYANLVVYSEGMYVPESEVQIERATTNLSEVMPWHITKDGYILQGFKLGDTLITASECYFEDCLDLEDNKFVNDFVVEAVWAKDKTVTLNEENSVVQIEIPSNTNAYSFLNLRLNNNDLLDLGYSSTNKTVFVDSINNAPGELIYDDLIYSYYDEKYNYLYIDFSRLINELNEYYKDVNDYQLYPYFLDTVSDTDFVTNYRFNLSNYQNLKTYYINDYDTINNKVIYNEVINTCLSPVINFNNNTGLVVKRMYYINNGRIIELENGDELNGTYNIYVDLAYFVKFVNNNNTADTETYVLKNAKLTEPVSPTKTGYKFVGWYSDENLTLKFDFSKNIMADTTLYAKYEIINSSIIFNTLGGTNVETITQGVFTQVSEPMEPSKHGYEFDGWYYDVNYKQIYVFTTMPVNDITLYAKWTPCTATLVYNSNDGNEYVFAQEFEYGKSEKVLTNIFTREGYKFIGWNTKADGTGKTYSVGELVNMSVSTLNVIDSDTPNELFAMWEEGIEGTPSIPNDTTTTNPSFDLDGTVTWSFLLMAIGVLAIVAFFLKRK